MRSVVLFHNENKVQAVRALGTVRRLIERDGVEVRLAVRRGLAANLKACDIAIAIGGDGTMLRTARLIAPYGLPLLGINTGGLGFLSAVDLLGFRHDLKRIFAGEYVMEPRWMLSVEVRRGRKTITGPEPALNDCVIRCSDHARAMVLEVESANQLVTSCFGDGLIIATPTGSTAYALAVGGPVVVPGVDALLVVPICSHALTQRPLVTSAEHPVAVRLGLRNPQDKPRALVSLDGQVQRALRVGDEVHIRRGPHHLNLLVPPGRSHFELLRSKLKWGMR